MTALHIVFDGPPSHESGRFVEVEDETGRSVNAGEWRHRSDGLWELVIDETTTLERAIDRMGWPEIHAFHEELKRGQDIYEDAGGYMLRTIKALFGLPRKDAVTTYQDAARAMVREAQTREESTS